MSYRVSNHKISVDVPEPKPEAPLTAGDFFTLDDEADESLYLVVCGSDGNYHYVNMSTGYTRYTYSELKTGSRGWTRVPVGSIVSLTVTSGLGVISNGRTTLDDE